ncbi:MAG: DUF6174 domain-containing protein [Bacteroidota bacterium]
MRAFLLLAALALSGCSFLDDTPDDFENARSLWSDRDVETYTMTLSRACFCLPESLGPFEVRVENGAIVSAMRDGQPVPASDVLTVDALFDLLEDAYDEGAHSVRAEYDAALGFPLSVSIDYDEDIADEEIGYTVTDLSAD